MIRWWKGVALIGAWLALSEAAVWAQYTAIPSPVGAARMPEPIPSGAPGEAPPPAKPLPELMPGPVSPLAAPPGPGPELSLSATSPGAFPCDSFPLESAFYGHVGVQALQRQWLGKGLTAFLDPGDGTDTGFSPLSSAPTAQRYNDIIPPILYGARATVGYLFNTQAIELTGFYLFNQDRKFTTTNQGRLDLPFTNAPAGFEGNNGLFLQADAARTTMSTQVSNLELNYRSWNGGIQGVEFILGLRYSFVQDRLGIYAGDDDVLAFNPLSQATYSVDVRNNIVAPQIGAEYQTNLPTKYLDWIYLGCGGKAAVGADFISVHNSLTRGDGTVGFDYSHTTITMSQIYELNAFVDFHFLQRARLRLGYTGLWFVDVGTSVDRVDFNLANPAGRNNKSGSILYHGPSIEFQFLF